MLAVDCDPDVPSSSAGAVRDTISIPVTSIARIEASSIDQAKMLLLHCHDMRFLALDFRWEASGVLPEMVRGVFGDSENVL